MQLYTHIASFFRQAPPEQQDRQWLTLARALDERLREVGRRTNVWVSTNGLGVSWLHMRLDLTPKYYQYKAYRDPERGLGNLQAALPEQRVQAAGIDCRDRRACSMDRRVELNGGAPRVRR